MSLDEIAGFLERGGWTKDVAKDDFENAVLSIDLMLREHLGIIVAGEYGVGKTKLCQILAKGFGGAFTVNLGMKDEVDKLTPEWLDCFAEPIFRENVFLDDLGSEHQVNEYGVRSEVVTDFISTYHLRKAPNVRLIVSTNLNEEQLDERYGGRMLSRLRELCTPLLLHGSDKRQWKLPL